MVDILNSFIIMVLFLTRIPIPYRVDYSEESLERGIKFLPLVGFLVGLIVYGFAELLTLIGLDRGVVVTLAWTMYIIVTGGLHIDGLADTFDGYFSNRDKKRVLEIMKDSQIGTFGVLAIVLVTGISLISSYYLDNTYFLIYPVVGRSVALLVCYRSSYAREHGMGKVFVERCKISDVLIGNIPMVVLMIYVYGSSGIVSLATTFLLISLAVKKISKAIGGITGDIIGFTIEISQVVFLLLAYVLGETSSTFLLALVT